ncbi:AP-4 complex subunit beta-1-like isoform X3 [Zootermopsis nevadensis]|nr:AP-4 complex subunit beta-1-like isoform X3 [Zootermopsis nevadensis]
MSSWDSPTVNNNNNNNKDYNSGRYNENRHLNNRDSYDGNADNNHESTRNTNGGNDNDYGMWRKQQTSGGYGFGYGYPDSQRNPYYNPRSGIRSRGSQDRNSQRKNSNNSAKNNNTNSTLELHESSPLEQVEPCIIHCIFQEMRMLDDSAEPDESMVIKVMTKKIRDPEVRDFIEESVEDCFELLEMDNKRNKCEYSKNLALCLEEKGRRLVETVNTPGDITYLIGPVVKLLPCHNISVKKTAYSVLPRICSLHPDASFLAANTILQDCRDPNPAVKCLAVSTLCSLPPLLQEHAGHALNAALKDGNPRVRQTAVMGCSKVFKHVQHLMFEQGFVDRLYESIRDSDPVVVTSSLLVLDTVLASEGGVVVSRNMAAYLLQRLEDFPDPQLATVLEVLSKYKPQEEEELFKELSMLDPFLVHSSSAAVVVNCVKLFLKLTEEKHPHLKTEIIQRVVTVLKQFLSSGSSRESANHVLDFVLLLTEDIDWLVQFYDSPHLFYPQKYNTDLELALKKLRVLPYICTESNFKEILHTLEEKYCRIPKTCTDSIACVCLISTRMPHFAGSECLNVLIALLDSGDHIACDGVLNRLQDFNLVGFKDDEIRTLIRKVLMKIDLSIKDVPYILPILLGEFGELVDEQSPYVLESLARNFELYDDGMQSLTFTAALKMFLKMPAKCQHIFGEIMEKCLHDMMRNDSEKMLALQQRALKYYQLLKVDVHLVRKMLIAQ